MEDYSAESIEVLKGLEPVKRRPGMYTETTRPNHLAQEVIDNSVDEAISGFASKISVVLYEDGSLEVTDDGRGMPVDMHPTEHVPGIELIFCRLHAGGKFSGKNYKFSGGLHGVGISVVNALSEKLEAEVRRGGKVYRICFSGGDVTVPLHETGTCGQKNTGTRVRFWPDPRYFDTPKFLTSSLRHLLKAKAVLCPNLAISFEDRNTGEKDEWCFREGLDQYLRESLRDVTIIPAEPFSGKGELDGIIADWSICWITEGEAEVSESYVNLIPTVLGGTHVNGFRQGILDAVREYCDLRNLLPRGVKLIPDDISAHSAYVLSCKIPEPQFAGQTKEKLSNREASAAVETLVKDSFSLWLNSGTDEASELIDFFITAAEKRIRSARTVVRKKQGQGPVLPGKLTDCYGDDVSRRELFIVEGDSAGGSACQARDPEYQAILPLRGKILNTWDADNEKIMANNEIRDISVALGADPQSADLSELRYGKVCILADADSDGLHIATLLCALFVRHFPKLVEDGHVFVCMPPLFRVDIKKEVHYVIDEKERDAVISEAKRKNRRLSDSDIKVIRFKGLGEMDPPQLKETTLEPNTRHLVRLMFDPDHQDTESMMDMLLNGKRADDRRVWLEANGSLAEDAE